MYSSYFVKTFDFIALGIFLTSFVIKMTAVFGYLICPDALYRWKKRSHGIPADYAHLKN